MGANSPGQLTGTAVRVLSANFTRPADTTAYAVGDLIANSTTAGSVVPMSFANFSDLGSFYPASITLRKTGTSLTNASFRVHVYSTAPTVATTGDNGVYATNVAGNGTWLESFDGTMVAGHSDGCSVTCVPTEGVIDASDLGQNPTLYALIEARGAYTPTSGEVFTVLLNAEMN